MARAKVTKKKVIKKSITKKRISSKKRAPLLRKNVKGGHILKKQTFGVERFEQNPIIVPRHTNAWESKATFNAAAIHDGEKVHLIYRAIGSDDVSVLGYASSTNGFEIDERLTKPVYSKRGSFKKVGEQMIPHSGVPYSSGGGWNGGCEDPRLTCIDDTVYMTYTAFDHWNSIRMALTSITLDDFKNKKWHWTKAVYISPPGQIHKNWVIFPEKINGKYAVLHSISPTIQIEYVDSLKHFTGETFITSNYRSKEPYNHSWDNWVRGVGPSPMKTKYGWLILYHAMDKNDPNRYKLGALLLDINNPGKILYRSSSPILEPDEHYENAGFKAGVIYCCGAVIKDNSLFVYYGGADTVVCVASVDLDTFLKELMATGTAHLTNVKKKKSTKK